MYTLCSATIAILPDLLSCSSADANQSLCETRPLRTFDFGKRAIKLINVYDTSPLQYLSKTFTCSSKVTLPNIRKGLVKVTFPSRTFTMALSKSLRSLKVYFRAVSVTMTCIIDVIHVIINVSINNVTIIIMFVSIASLTGRVRGSIVLCPPPPPATPLIILIFIVNSNVIIKSST